MQVPVRKELRLEIRVLHLGVGGNTMRWRPSARRCLGQRRLRDVWHLKDTRKENTP